MLGLIVKRAVCQQSQERSFVRSFEGTKFKLDLEFNTKYKLNLMMEQVGSAQQLLLLHFDKEAAVRNEQGKAHIL